MPPVDPPAGGDALLCVRAPPEVVDCPGTFPQPRPAWLDADIDCDCSCSVPGGCQGTIDTSTAANCVGCASGTCPSFDVADTKCKDVDGINGPLYAKLSVTDPGEAMPAPLPVHFSGPQAALYCCQDYPAL